MSYGYGCNIASAWPFLAIRIGHDRSGGKIRAPEEPPKSATEGAAARLKTVPTADVHATTGVIGSVR